MRSLLVCSSLCLSLAWSVAGNALTSLTGDWRVTYGAAGGCLAYAETARVVQDGIAWRIHKTSAHNACVPIKVVAVWGRLGDAISRRCFLTVGTSTAPANRVIPCRYTRITEDSFRIDNDEGSALTFNR